MKSPSARKLSLPVITSILLAAVPLITTSVLTAWAIQHEDILRGWSPFAWAGVTLLLTVASAIALSPPTFLALVYGYFLGWLALPFLFALNIGAISLVYSLAHLLNADATRNYIKLVYPGSEALLKRFHQNEFRLIFFAKLSPVLPFAVTNLFFAMAGARLRQVLTGGSLGMIPRTVLAVWAGKEAQNIRYLLEHPNEGLMTKILLFTLIIISTVGIGYFFRDKTTA